MTNLSTLAATGGFTIAFIVYSVFMVALITTAGAGPKDPTPRRLLADRHVRGGVIATGLILAWLAALIIA